MLAAVPFQLDLAEEKIEKITKFLVFKKVLWGWSIVVAGLLDFYSDFAIQNRTTGDFGDVSAWSDVFFNNFSLKNGTARGAGTVVRWSKALLVR